MSFFLNNFPLVEKRLFDPLCLVAPGISEKYCFCCISLFQALLHPLPIRESISHLPANLQIRDTHRIKEEGRVYKLTLYSSEKFFTQDCLQYKKLYRINFLYSDTLKTKTEVYL